jgi:hypothetical protein
MKGGTILNLGKQGGVDITAKPQKLSWYRPIDGYLWRDKLETKGYIGVRRDVAWI